MAGDISISDATAIEGSDTLKFIDSFIAHGSGGLNRPRQPLLGPDGNGDGVLDLYVASADTDEILRYDGSTGAFLDAFVTQGSGGLDGPADLEFGPDGNLYVSGFEGNHVFRYDGQTGAFLGQVASGLAGPIGLSFGDDGGLYIGTNGSGVLRYDGASLTTFVPLGSGGLSRARHAVFGPDGNGDAKRDLYVTSSDTGRVLRYDGSTGTFIDVFVVMDAPPAPWIEFGPDGDLYVLTQKSGGSIDITRFDTKTRVIRDTLSIGQSSLWFILGPDGVLYHPSSRSLLRYGPSSLALFTVTLSEPSASPVTVNYATTNGTAGTGSDYVGASGTLTFAPGQRTQTILVKTLDDTDAESSETFNINLSNAVGATTADGQGVGTIQDDDFVGPTLSIGSASVTEEGGSDASFTVRLSAPSSSTVTVNYATADETAVAGINYIAASGTLTFAAGQTVQAIFVPILNDGTTYLSETFRVNLSDAVGAAIADSTGVATIVDSDATDFKFTLRASSNGQALESFLGNPVSPDESPFHTWPMKATEPLLIETDVSKSRVDVFIELPAESNGPDGGILLEAGQATNRLHIRGGRVRIDSLSTDGTLDTTVDAGAELVTARLQQNGLTVNGDGRVTLLTGGETSRLTGLSLDTDAMLDLADNALVVDYTGASPLATIRDQILSGRGGPGFGASWTGAGINSTTAAAGNATNPETWSVGFAENSALPLGPYTTFRGQAVDATSVLIAYTRTGDANLDGLVNDDDVTIIGATYAPGVPQPHWALGDFDYNGFVDDDDATLLGVFYDPAAAPVAAPVPRHQTAETRVPSILAESIYGSVSLPSLPSHVDAAAVQQMLAHDDEAFRSRRKQIGALIFTLHSIRP